MGMLEADERVWLGRHSDSVEKLEALIKKRFRLLIMRLMLYISIRDRPNFNKQIYEYGD